MTALKADETFGMMGAFLDEGLGGDIVKKVGAVFAFEITEKKGGPAAGVFEIDLKNGNGFCKKQKPAGKVDATFVMTDNDYADLSAGKINGQTAFMTGKMKIKGNMAKAMKFTPDLFPAANAENLAEYHKKQAAKL